LNPSGEDGVRTCRIIDVPQVGDCDAIVGSSIPPT
jgi:hypothetical protein